MFLIEKKQLVELHIVTSPMRFCNLRVTVGWRGCSIAYVIAEHVNKTELLITLKQRDTGCKRGDVMHWAEQG